MSSDPGKRMRLVGFVDVLLRLALVMADVTSGLLRSVTGKSNFPIRDQNYKHNNKSFTLLK